MPAKPVRKSGKITKKRKKGFSWRTLSKSKKSRKKALKSVIAFSLVLVSIVFLSTLLFYRSITKSSVFADSLAVSAVGDQDLVSLLIVSVDGIDERPVHASSVHFLFLDISKKKVVVYNIPLEVEIDVPGKFGTEPFSSLMPLGMLEENDLKSGIDMISESVKKVFGYNVDKYLLVGGEDASSVVRYFATGEGFPVADLGFIKSLMLDIDTDLSISEFYRLYKFVGLLPSDRFMANKWDSEYFVDSNIDEGIRDLSYDSWIAEERASVAVLNGSGVPGMASFGSRVVKNMGGHVIDIGNSFEKYGTTIIIAESLDLAVVKGISRFFDVKEIILRSTGTYSEDIIDRADVTVIIGLDTARKM